MPGCYELVGAVIRQAVLDYRAKNCKNKYRQKHWQDAERFLFKHGALERFLEQFGMEDALNLDYVRRLAKTDEIRKGQSYHYSIHD